jgi:hypothetical protein
LLSIFFYGTNRCRKRTKKVYSPDELVARKLGEGDLEDVLVHGRVTGVSNLPVLRLLSEDPQGTIGFYLDEKLFCLYASCVTFAELDILRASTWLDQQRNREVVVGGHYINIPSTSYLKVGTFYKDLLIREELF